MAGAPRIAVVGLGYVGSVEAAVLAASGRTVVGVDVRPAVVAAMDAGTAPLAEPLLEERLAAAKARGTLSATLDLAAAVAQTDAALVCVGTPRGADGELDTTALLGAVVAIARSVRTGARYSIIVRSTVPPGFHASARRAIDGARAWGGEPDLAEIGLALNPEFLREGSAVRDREEPQLVVYAADAPHTEEAIRAIYREHADRLVACDPASAEVLKLVNNAWHALKVSVANEVARLGRPLGVDPFELMHLLCRDTKLNTSAAYLRPGMPFGGACLVKDMASLATYAEHHGVRVPVMQHVLASNDAHLGHLLDAVLGHRTRAGAPARCVAIVGIGFKPGAPDVRDSAPVAMAVALLDRGLAVRVADANVLDARVPPLGIDALRVALGDPRAVACETVEEAVREADVVVVGHPAEADRRALVVLAGTIQGRVLDVSGELSRALSEHERRSLAPVDVLRAHGAAGARAT
ncbi:MAG: nucleotide sugar dehydrogenase [Deltaproteobacteria bacterium]